MEERKKISGFSKLSKEEKLTLIANHFDLPGQAYDEFSSYLHPDEKTQDLFDEFSENTITNFYLPYNVAPNFLINDKIYIVPMVIEESSVVAAASKSAKFWAERGGFKARVLSTSKIGQVHFIWLGDGNKLKALMPELKEILIKSTSLITHNMVKRGGGIKEIELVDMAAYESGYYQLRATFETCDSMGANFINSCLEEFARQLKIFIQDRERFTEKEVHVIISILSNYTPECLVEAYVECRIDELGIINEHSPEEFAWKFQKAAKIAEVDSYRAVTHNKGVFNGTDAVVLATGNDFRAVEACGHAYAARDGKYKSLTTVDIDIEKNKFKYMLTLPLALGVVGGITALHPLAKRSLQLLGSPNAKELMMIAAAVGLANNFAALKSLVTTGIQKGHMKMHLLNILNQFEATETQKEQSMMYFKDNIVSYNAVRNFLEELRENAVAF